MYEIRWFYKIKASDEIKKWIKLLPKPDKITADEDLRNEVYLHCMENIGLKISRGGLE
jgi:hypothetical protein